LQGSVSEFPINLEGTAADLPIPMISPVLANRNEQGLKRRGMIYSPRKSWWMGVFFVALSIAIFTITIITAIVPYD
jgi:hypothetical protein